MHNGPVGPLCFTQNPAGLFWSVERFGDACPRARNFSWAWLFFDKCLFAPPLTGPFPTSKKTPALCLSSFTFEQTDAKMSRGSQSFWLEASIQFDHQFRSYV